MHTTHDTKNDFETFVLVSENIKQNNRLINIYNISLVLKTQGRSKQREKCRKHMMYLN